MQHNWATHAAVDFSDPALNRRHDWRIETYYTEDAARDAFASLCESPDVQRAVIEGPDGVVETYTRADVRVLWSMMDELDEVRRKISRIKRDYWDGSDEGLIDECEAAIDPLNAKAQHLAAAIAASHYTV